MGGTVYAIAGGKGGVGKTTTVINLGVVLAQAGQSVVVVDADLAMTNLGQRLGIEHEPSLHQVLAGDATVRDAVVRGPGGLAAITGDRTLESFAAADPTELDRVLDLLSVAYDIVLVDTGPGVQRDTFVTYRAADGVVVVTTQTGVATEDANRTATMAADADCPAVGAVVTRADAGTDPEHVTGLDMDVLAVVPEHRTGGPVTAAEPASDAAGAYRTLAAALPAVDADSVMPDQSESVDEPDDVDVADTEPVTAGAPDSEPDVGDAGKTAAGDGGTTTAAGGLVTADEPDGRADAAETPDSNPSDTGPADGGSADTERANGTVRNAVSAYRTLTAALPSISATGLRSTRSSSTDDSSDTAESDPHEDATVDTDAEDTTVDTETRTEAADSPTDGSRTSRRPGRHRSRYRDGGGNSRRQGRHRSRRRDGRRTGRRRCRG